MIPVNEPLLDGNEKRYLCECIDSGWISSEGPFVERFEEAFALRHGRLHGIAVANGSLALDLAFAALDLAPGDEVVLPSFTIISCAAAIVRAGGVPIPVDCDRSWNMDPALLEAAIGPRTKAILVVHIYGLPSDMDRIGQIAGEKGITIVEDAAQAHGQSFREYSCGSFGLMSTFSFYPNKHVTTGEGGMVLVDDPRLAGRLRSMRNLCFAPPRRFVHEALGWNYRMSNIQAALGVAQLERLTEFVARKRRMGALYQELLAGVDGLELPLPGIEGAVNHYWVFGVVLKNEIPFDAAEAMLRLSVRGVGTRPFFWPIHEQPVFSRMGWFKGARLPNSERIARRGFYLPSGLALTDNQIRASADALADVIRTP